MFALEKISISKRLLVAGLAVAIGLTSLAVYSLAQIKRDALAAHSERIKDLVEASRGIIGNYQKLEADRKLTREEAQLQAKEALRSPRFGTNDYFFIYDFDGRAVMVAGSQKLEGQILLGKTDAAGYKMWDAIVAIGKAGAGFVDYAFPRAGQTEPKPKRGYVIGIPEWQWIVGTGVYVDDIDETVKRSAIRYAMISLVILCAVGAIAYLTSRSILRSLSSLQTTIARIEGDLDFTVHVPIIANDEIARVSEALNRLQEKLRSSFTAVTLSTQKLSSAATNLASSSDEVATSSAEQSDSASAMAASLEQMTVSISHVSDRTAETHAISVKSGQLAEEGEQILNRTVQGINEVASAIEIVSQKIQELERSNSQISSIVSVIREVADQTNLLALNAAIEAARAGEHGRGFSVVADEVRKLAERTAASTVEISQTIGEIQKVSEEIIASAKTSVESVNNGIVSATEASQAISRLGDGSRQVIEMVEEITHAIREQSQACNTLANNVETIAQKSETNSAVAQDSRESAHVVANLATELGKNTSVYKI